MVNKGMRKSVKRAKEGNYRKPLPGEPIEEGITYSIARADGEIRKKNFDLGLANLTNAYKLSEQLLANSANAPLRKKYAIAIVRRLGRILDKSGDEEQQDYASKFAYQIRTENRIKPGLNLEKFLSIIIAIGGFGFGLFFLSSNITGNVVGNSTNASFSWIGGILLVFGIAGALLYFKKK